MTSEILFFGFIALIDLYFLGVMFVLLNMTKLEQDKKKKKKLLYGLYYLIFLMVVLSSMSIIVFFITNYVEQYPKTYNQTAIHTTNQQQTTIEDDGGFIFGVFTFFNMLILIPLIWLVKLLGSEQYLLRRKNILYQIYLISILDIVLYTIVVVLN
ncbi:MAG: hypothetical protein LBT09_05970 [Planctomycetaceae bacterium]|jgi:hypothetical protein|nr:hypothetical protein [Planctomycetaceae bacterium]